MKEGGGESQNNLRSDKRLKREEKFRKNDTRFIADI
jgi:hypothetical protein